MKTEALVTAEEPTPAELQASAELQISAEQQAAGQRAPDEHTADELRDAAAHGVRWSAIARPTVEILQLGSIVILARLIVPAEFGRYAIALIAQEVAYLMVAGG